MFTRLIATKYCRPPLRLDCVPRTGLLRRLDEIARAGQRLLLISAPAGYGKTTLLMQCVTRQHADQTWSQADVTHAASERKYRSRNARFDVWTQEEVDRLVAEGEDILGEEDRQGHLRRVWHRKRGFEG